MSTLQQTPAFGASSIPHSSENDRWEYASQQLLAAVPAGYRSQVERSLNTLYCGGRGLREWVNAIAWRGAVVPAEIPAELIEVYLHDSQAVPHHDCGECGLAVPVRPSQLHGIEAEPDHVYFPECPCCGGRTGSFMYWSSMAESDRISGSIQRRKAR